MRDLFAAQAMQIIIIRDQGTSPPSHVGFEAYAYADAMLAASGRKEGEQ